MFLTIFIFGVGIHGGAAEIVDLFRHLAPEESRIARWITTCLAKSVWLSFTWQWTTIVRLVLAHHACLAESLTSMEQAVWSLCFLVFFCTQIGSIRAMNAVASRSWGSIEQPPDRQSARYPLDGKSPVSEHLILTTTTTVTFTCGQEIRNSFQTNLPQNDDSFTSKVGVLVCSDSDIKRPDSSRKIKKRMCCTPTTMEKTSMSSCLPQPASG